MDRLRLIAVSLARHSLDEYIETLREELDAKTAEYDGPMPLQRYETELPFEPRENSEGDSGDESVPSWIEECDLPSIDIATISPPSATFDDGDSIVVFGRKMRIYNTGPIRAVMDIEEPDPVHVEATLDTVKSHGVGRSVPPGYNPYQDNQPHPE